MPRYASEYARRRAAISAGLEQRDLDALLVSAGPNLRYLTGFTGDNAMLLMLPGGAVMFTDPRYRIQAAAQADCKVRVSTGPLLSGVVAATRQHRIRRLGFERARMSFETHDWLRSRLPLKAALEPVTGWIEQHRMIKSESEIAALRRSALTASKAFEQAVRRVKLGARECDLAAEIEYRMRRLGADRPAFETIVAAGPRSALPHASPTTKAFRPGDLVVVDMGAIEDGYASDMTRMLFFGVPSARVKRLYGAVREAQEAALAIVRPGVAAAQVDRVARRVLKAHGLARAFVHSTGHGLGLEIHEPPRLGRTETTRLREGMAITIEPGAYIEGFGGVRIEDTVVVTAAGCEILTPTPKDLRLL
jgi:Xaa-Pro aminopeptidase